MKNAVVPLLPGLHASSLYGVLLEGRLRRGGEACGGSLCFLPCMLPPFMGFCSRAGFGGVVKQHALVRSGMRPSIP